MRLSELKVGDRVKGINDWDERFTGTVKCIHLFKEDEIYSSYACINLDNKIRKTGLGCEGAWKVDEGYWAKTQERLVRSDAISEPLEFIDNKRNHPFKEGDIVRMTENCSGCKKGKKYILKYLTNELYVMPELGIYGCSCQRKWKLVSKNNISLTNKIMSTTSKLFKKLTRKEPEKTFVKAGFMDEDEQITPDGKEALEYLLWKANVEELKKLAAQVLEDKKDTNE